MWERGKTGKDDRRESRIAGRERGKKKEKRKRKKKHAEWLIVSL